jgi:cytochrome c-type biogenesis protein CcmH
MPDLGGLSPIVMTLGFVFALMTAGAIFAVLWPLARRRPAIAGSEIAVYRDQLDEIERDRSAGRIGEEEAKAARVEVSRRLLAAADAQEAATAPRPVAGPRRAAAVVALLALPLFAAALYLAIGSPMLPDQPLSARATEPRERQSVESLVAQVEAHLARNPDDGRGWELLAPVYLRLGRLEDAIKARRNALNLNGETAERMTNLGEALVAAANGVVTAEAKEAFERAVALDHHDAKARYFLGLAAEQDGKPSGAAAIWRGLLTESPDAQWAGFVREALARVEGAAPVIDGSDEEVAAAARMSPEARAAMVNGMVERLADRLARDRADVDGWMRLVRSYLVLGQHDKAVAAASAARAALATEPDKLRKLDAFAVELGLNETQRR